MRKYKTFLDMKRFHDTLEVKLVVSIRDYIVIICLKQTYYQFAKTNISFIYLYAKNILIKNQKTL